MIRVGLVGLGIGGAHADGFKRLPEQFEVVAVCDPDDERAKFFTDWLGCERADDLTALCTRDDIDIVDLCTPPFLHREQIEQVLTSGKHVICEKPLVGSLAEVDELAAIEAASPGRIMPILQYRYGRGLQKLKHLVDAGLAGAANSTTIDVAWRRKAEYYDVPWRGKFDTEMGGVLLSHALHAIDMLTYVNGPIARVFARTATMINDIETEDVASVSFAMADGSFATLSATLGSPQEITRHRFCFEHLSAESNTEAYENHREPWTFVGDSPEIDERIAASLEQFEPQAELYKGQFARLHRALTDGTELPVTLADARAGLEVITAAYVSAREGRDIALPLDPNDPAHGGWR